MSKITCDKKLVGRLIGTQGTTIRRLQHDSGCNITVENASHSGQSNSVTIQISSPDTRKIHNALQAVNQILYPPCIRLKCSNKQYIGNLIGTRGCNIRRLQEETGAKIDIDSNSNPAIITVTGFTEHIRKDAAAKVLHIIEPPHATFQCSSTRRVGRLIGPNGRTIKRLENDTKTRIQVITEGKKREHNEVVVVDISGETIDNVEQALAFVKAILTPMTLELTATKSVAGYIIGENGENIKELTRYLNRVVCGGGSMSGKGRDGDDGKYEYKTTDSSSFEQKQRRIAVDEAATVDPLTPFVELEILGTWYDDDERTITLQLQSNDSEILHQCSRFVQHEIDAALRSQDYVGEEGKQLRAEAHQWSARRSKLLDASQQAYVAGNKEDASRLAVEGRHAGEKMRQANIAARDSIYARRNAGTNVQFLDLHGLYVQEALYYLEHVLSKLLSNDRVDQLECVTGAGHHSPYGHSKIKQAVHNVVVEKLGLQYEVKNEGSYLIYC
jgi:rRNA processing protein Krr1/Pno1/DNA-nicking Smr family endonuclease